MNFPRFNFHLNTYKYPPKNTVNLPDLETLCLERLELYKIMVQAYYLNLVPNTKNWVDYLTKEITAKKLITYSILLQKEVVVGTFKARKRDHLAHWVLSLCYSKVNEQRNFFVKFELLWLMCLYGRMEKSELHQFLQENDLLPEEVCITEKIMVGCDFFTTSEVSEEDVFRTEFYKSHFTQVLCLVKSRKIILDHGIAYFPEVYLIYYVMTKLETQFLEQLEWNSKMLSVIESNDPRFYDFLQYIPVFVPTMNTTVDYTDINLQNIDYVSKHHYPLCMQNIHNHLKTDHHLKYDCKMQYGIFLKWLGLPYEDALQFWKGEFTKHMSENLYVRKYQYLFKHHYGMVGGRIQYKPFSCKYILQYQPRPMQHHGCPFKHWDKEKLIKTIDHLTKDDIKDIEELITGEKYEMACTKYFCAKNKVVREDAIESPNQYCRESLEVNYNLNNLIETIFDEL